eukprot:7386673-Prymnesium_polylepis.2
MEGQRCTRPGTRIKTSPNGLITGQQPPNGLDPSPSVTSHDTSGQTHRIIQHRADWAATLNYCSGGISGSLDGTQFKQTTPPTAPVDYANSRSRPMNEPTRFAPAETSLFDTCDEKHLVLWCPQL